MKSLTVHKLLPTHDRSQATQFCYSDASDVAMGGFVVGQDEGWRFDFSDGMESGGLLKGWHITATEMLALHMNVQKCLELANGTSTHIIAYVDNKAVQDIALKGRALTSSMEWLWAPIRRKLNEANSWLTVCWISTENNKVADLLSRQENSAAIRASQPPPVYYL
jgi:hypothetical protein